MGLGPFCLFPSVGNRLRAKEVSASSDPDLAEAALDFPDARDATTCSERGEEGEDDATSKSEIHQAVGARENGEMGRLMFA